MNKEIVIRFADSARDAASIRALYAPYIEKTAVTFEYVVPEPAAFERRVADIAAEFPYLLLEIDGELAGYAYAHRQAERAAFGWNAELSIYLKESFTGRGLGMLLYRLLEELLEMQGYINFYGVITASNAGSIALHERMGYKIIGTHERTGYKFGVWHGVVWMHRRANEDAPHAIVPAHALDLPEVSKKIENTRKRIEEIWNSRAR
jgi:phosphinothricin acetyltransferase